MAEVEVAFASADVLGESVLWSPTDGMVLWIDGNRGLLHRFDPATRAHTEMPIPGTPPIGVVLQTRLAGVLAVADRDGIWLWRIARGTRHRVAHPEQGREGVAYNDAKADRDGRLWFGTFDVAETESRGGLWRSGSNGDANLVESGLAVANGPAFSPDGKYLYLSDSVARRILVYDVADDPPFLRRRRVLVVLSEQEGLPDGLTVDAEGGVWCAQWGGACVTRFSPGGERDRIIPMPAAQVTSLAFGGKDLATLYITSARLDLGPAELARQPHSGSLFAVRPGMAGLAETPLVIVPA